MSRQEDKLPIIGQNPGSEPWGYDRKAWAEDALEGRLHPREVIAQLEQRFKVKHGSIITFSSDIYQGKYQMTEINEIYTRLTKIPQEKRSKTVPTWHILHCLNKGEAEVEN